MKVAYSILGNASGSMGGLVASRNTYGPYFRRRAIPVNPNTTGQQAVRLAFSDTSQAWQTLTLEQQQAWITGGPLNVRPNRVGGSQALTGQALFMRINAFRQQLGLAVLLTPPTSIDVPAITLPVIQQQANMIAAITFDDDDAWNQEGGGIIVSVSALQGNGRNFINQFYTLGGGRILGHVTGQQVTNIPFDTRSGGKLRYRFAAITPDGRLTDAVFVDTTVPRSPLVTSFVISSATDAVVTFDADIDATDFAAGDFTGPWRTTVSAVAQGADNELELTGTGFAAALAWAMNPSNGAALYVAPQSGITST